MNLGGTIMRVLYYSVVNIAIVCACAKANATVTQFYDRALWQSAVGAHTIITFQEYPKHTVITDQYESLGVLFPDGNDAVDFSNGFLNDGVGLVSDDIVIGMIHLEFARPMTAIAAEFRGLMDIQLYSDGQLIFQSNIFSTIASRFGGVVSTVPFDAAVIRDPSDGAVSIDDLYFGPPIPAPGALLLFLLAPVLPPRWRTR